MGCVVSWGTQRMGVHGNGVHDVLGCTGHKSAWEWGAWFTGVHREWGCMGMGSAMIRVCRAPGCTRLGCVVYRGAQDTRVHRNGVHGLLGCTLYWDGDFMGLGAWFLGVCGRCGLHGKQSAWGWGVIYWGVQGMQVHGDLGCMGTGCKNYWGADVSCGVSRGAQGPEGTVYPGTQELGSTGIWGM